jgi:hypothetical protein
VLDYRGREEGDSCVIFSKASCLVAKWRTISGVIVGINHDVTTAGDGTKSLSASVSSWRVIKREIPG